MVDKKAQAAMEFLMTYGWAILAVLISIGALAYFGVLSPNLLLPNSCTLFPGVACSDFVIDGSGNFINMQFRNGLGNAINIYGVTSSEGGCPNSNTLIIAGGTFFNVPAVDPFGVVSDGQEAFIILTSCTNLPSAGSRFKTEITLDYAISGETLRHVRTGEIVGEVD